MDARCRIELLGGLKVILGERTITRFRTRQTGALLAYLAYHLGPPLAREVVIEALWPEIEPRTGRNNLSMALTSLRGQLEPPGTDAGAVIQSDRFTVRLNPAAVVTDVAEFLTALQEAERANEDTKRNRALRQAIDLYSGTLLPGYYDEWTAWERHRLQELFAKAEEILNVTSSVSLPAVTAPTLPSPKPQSQHIHLPLQFTHFFGREVELGVLESWCAGNPRDPTHHLITLTGPGGTGKTRLAIEAAGRLAEAFPGGVWFIPLQDLSDPRLIPGTVLDALRLPRSPQIEPLHQAVEFLNRRASATLLLLDNMEHLLDMERRKAEDGAAVVRTLLDRCPLLTCLVTSQQSLNLEGERELPILPLPTPNVESLSSTPDAQHLPPESLMQFASVQLFVDRAQASKPDFQVTQGNSAAIAQLCDRLEGIPLALALAAGRAQVMTPKQMLSQLEHRFDFLVSRRRDAIERHRTLQAAIAWSYRLLSPEVRRFFVQLSVFRGGWTIEAAAAVCEEPLALDYLAQLQECSLIRAEESADGMRFRMLETLREFGWEQMSPEECAALSQRHLKYFLQMAEEAAEAEPQNETILLNYLEADHDNLRMALSWCHANTDGVEAGLRLAGALGWFWDTRGHWSEGSDHLTAALGREGAMEATPERAKALRAAGKLSFYLSRYALAQSLYQESLAIYQKLGIRRGVAQLLGSLGELTNYFGDPTLARSFLEESLALWREIQDRRGIAWALIHLGNSIGWFIDAVSANSLYQEGLTLFQELGDNMGIAWSLHHMGDLSVWQGKYSEGCSLLQKSLALHQEQKDRLGIACAHWTLGNAAYNQGDYALARALFEESLKVFQELDRRQMIMLALFDLGKITRDQGDYDMSHALYARIAAIMQHYEGHCDYAGLLGAFGHLAHVQGQEKRAGRLWGAEEALRAKIGSRLPAREPDKNNRHAAEARQSLGADSFALAWEEGLAMTTEQALTYALGTADG